MQEQLQLRVESKLIKHEFGHSLESHTLFVHSSDRTNEGTASDLFEGSAPIYALLVVHVRICIASSILFSTSLIRKHVLLCVNTTTYQT